MRRHILRFFALVIAVVVIVTVAGGGFCGSCWGASAGHRRHAEAGRAVAAGHRDSRRAGGADHQGAVACRSRPRGGVRPRAGAVLPDGPAAAAAGRRVVGAGRPGHRERRPGDAHPPFPAHRPRASPTRRPNTRLNSNVRRRRQRRARGAGGAAVRVRLLRRRRNPGRPRTRCSRRSPCTRPCRARSGEYEATLGAMHEVMPTSLFEFLAGRASDWESPIVGPQYPVPPIPGPTSSTYAPARGRARATRNRRGKDLAIRATRRPAPRQLGALVGAAAQRGGSHARQQQLGGRRRARRRPAAPSSPTTCTCAFGAEHLVPGRLRVSRRAARHDPSDGRGDAARRAADGRRQQRRHRLGLHQLGPTGPTWSSSIRCPATRRGTRRRMAGGLRPHQESITVKGAAPVPLEARWTIRGPVVGDDHRGRPQALKWVAHDPRVLATDAARIAEARDVDEAMRLSVGAALAAENLVVGDRGGRIAWTITVRSPGGSASAATCRPRGQTARGGGTAT